MPTKASRWQAGYLRFSLLCANLFHLVYTTFAMRIEMDVKLDFDDVLIRPKRSTIKSRKDVKLERTFKFPHGGLPWTGVPIIASNMDGVGTVSMMQALAHEQMMTALHKHHPVPVYAKILQEHTFITIGIQDAEVARLKKIKKIIGKSQPRFLCIDVANGYTENFVSFVKKIRALCPKTVIMAGNVVTGEMAEQLVLSGADIVKVGIGPGSVCTTRRVTGVGYPQLSAIIECADAVHGLGGFICADGGCRTPGDVAKAFGAGSDFVMLGGMLSGHDESEMEVIEKDGKSYIEFYGSSSSKAMTKHNGGRAFYRASEGKSVHIPYRGPVKETVEGVLGGVRSACAYVGARTLKGLNKCTTFVQVQHQINTSLSKFEV